MTAGNKVVRVGRLLQTKSVLKSTFPRGAVVYGKVKDAWRDIITRGGPDAEAVFSNAAVDRTSTEAFRMECLWPVESSNSDYRPAEVPFYEQYGEQQVAAGYYQQVLRYHEHIAPIAEALNTMFSGASNGSGYFAPGVYRLAPTGRDTVDRSDGSSRLART